jgi:WD40 repeat protein
VRRTRISLLVLFGVSLCLCLALAWVLLLQQQPRPAPEVLPEPAGLPQAPMPAVKPATQSEWPDEGREGLPAEVVRQYGSRRFRHREPIISVCTGPDPTVVYSVDKTGIYCWEVATGNLKFYTPRNPDDGEAREIACSAELLRVYTWGNFHRVERYDPKTGRLLGRGKDITFSHGALWLDSGGDVLFRRAVRELKLVGNMYVGPVDIHLHDPEGEREPIRIGDANNYAISPDGLLFATAEESKVRIIGLPRGELKDTWDFRDEKPSLVCFTPDSQGFVAWTGVPEKRVLRMCDLKSRTTRDLSELGELPQFARLRPAHGENLFVYDDTLDCVFVDPVSLKRVRRWSLYPSGYFAAFTPDGKFGFYAQHRAMPGRTLIPIDMQTGLPASHSPLPEEWCWALRYHTDGKLVLVSGGRSRYLEMTSIRDLMQGFLDGTFHTYQYPSDQLSPDGAFVVGVQPPSNYPKFSTGGKVRLTDPKTGAVTVEPDSGPARSNAFTPDGERVYWVTSSREPGSKALELVEWSVKDRGEICRRAVPTAEDYEVSASPDGRWLACAWREPRRDNGNELGAVGVEVWDRNAPGALAQRLVMMNGYLFPVLRFPQRGEHLFAIVTTPGEPCIVQEWDLSTGKHLRSLPPDPRVKWCNGLSPDGRMFVSGAENGELYLVELRTGRIRHIFRGHKSQASGPFSPDGKHVAAVSADAPIYIWDVRGELTRVSSPPDEAALNRAWDALAGEPEAAFQAIRLLAGFPAQSLPFLRAKGCPTGLRAARAVEAAEWIGTPEAVKLLESWLDVEDDAVVIGEAQEALARLKKK